MSRNITILFSTESNGKFTELSKYLESYKNITLIMVKPSKEIYEIQSLDRNMIVMNKLNAVLKDMIKSHVLSSYSNISNGESFEMEYWLMVEDTSFCIHKLGGFPGPFVKFFLDSMSLESIAMQNSGSLVDNIATLCVGRIILENNKLQNMISFESIIKGKIASSPRGTNGFGYDPIFIPVGENHQHMYENGKTNAELSLEVKNTINARTHALRQFINYLGM
jgi:non-canonical purine NTP pyrophosphatase (RdgB/HAM1 family)